MKAFLSYASERLSTARIVHKFCKECGIDIFLDKVNIVGGQDWNQEIKRAQREADLTFLLLSKESLTKTGVLQEEIRETLRMIEKRPLGDIYLIVLRVAPLPLPQELTRWQYIDLFKRDWRKHVAQSLRQKASLMREREPKGLRQFLSEGPAEHKPEHIRYRNPRRDVTFSADYFAYLGSGRYWELVNAEIVVETHRAFYECLYSIGDSSRIDWHIRIEEFFREGDLISLMISSYIDFGGAHGTYGVSTMNFGGDRIGKLRITDLLDTAEDNFAFIKRYSTLELRKQFEGQEDAAADLIDYAGNYNWGFFGDFNLDKLGLVLNFSSRQGLPHVFGLQTVRIPWDDLRGRLQEKFCKTQAGRRLGLMKHGRAAD